MGNRELLSKKRMFLSILGFVCALASKDTVSNAIFFTREPVSKQLATVSDAESDEDYGSSEFVGESLPTNDFDVNVLNSQTLDLISYFVGKLFNTYDESELKGKVIIPNLEELVKLFLEDGAKSSLSKDVLECVKSLDGVRGSREGQVVFSERRIEALKRQIDSYFVSFLPANIERKFAKLAAYVGRLVFAKGIGLTVAGNYKWSVESISRACSKFSKVVKTIDSASGLDKSIIYFAISNYMRKVFKHLGLIKSNESELNDLCSYENIIRVVEKCKSLCSDVKEFVDKCYADQKWFSKIKIKPLIDRFKAYKTFMQALMSIVDTLNTKIDSIDLKEVDRGKQKELFEFLNKFKQNKLEKGTGDGRTFLDLERTFFTSLIGLGHDGFFGTDFATTLGVKKKEDAATLSDKALKNFASNAANAVFDQIKDKDGRALESNVSGNVYKQSIYAYFKRVAQAYDEAENNGVKLKYAGGFAGQGNVFSPAGIADLVDDAEFEPKVEKVFYNLMRSLCANFDQFQTAIMQGRFGLVAEALDFIKKNFSLQDNVQQDFVDILRSNETRDFLIGLTQTLTNFDMTKNTFNETYGAWAREVVNFINNKIKATGAIPQFLTYEPTKGKNELLGFNDTGRKLNTTTFKGNVFAVNTELSVLKTTFTRTFSDSFRVHANGDPLGTHVAGVNALASEDVTLGQLIDAFSDAIFGLRELFDFKGTPKDVGQKPGFYKIVKDVVNEIAFAKGGKDVNEKNDYVSKFLDVGAAGFAQNLGVLNANALNFNSPENKELMAKDFNKFNDELGVFSGKREAELTSVLGSWGLELIPNDAVTKKKEIEIPAGTHALVSELTDSERINWLQIVSKVAAGLPFSLTEADLAQDVFLQASDAIAASGIYEDGALLKNFGSFKALKDEFDNIKTDVVPVKGTFIPITILMFYNGNFRIVGSSANSYIFRDDGVITNAENVNDLISGFNAKTKQLKDREAGEYGALNAFVNDNIGEINKRGDEFSKAKLRNMLTKQKREEKERARLIKKNKALDYNIRLLTDRVNWLRDIIMKIKEEDRAKTNIFDKNLALRDEIFNNKVSLNSGSDPNVVSLDELDDKDLEKILNDDDLEKILENEDRELDNIILNGQPAESNVAANSNEALQNDAVSQNNVESDGNVDREEVIKPKKLKKSKLSKKQNKSSKKRS